MKPGATTSEAFDRAASRRLDAAVLASVALLAAALKGPVLATPYYWDETLWIGFAHELAKRPLWEVLPGLHPLFLFGNRPPGLFLPMAAIFKLTGPSIWLSHAYTVCFAVVGAFFTYRLASLWFGSLAGVLAAFLLVIDPVYFAQSAMFLSDLPTAAAAVAAVYFGVSRRFAIYWPCALYLLTLKEPAMAIVAALAAWAFFVRVRTSFREAVMDGARYAAPLVVMALYYLWQWAATGHPFVHYNYAFEAGSTNLAAARRQLPWVHRWLLVEQGRWMFGVLIVGALAVGSFRRRSELLLIALILVASGYSYAFLYFLPRYLLPVAPFFYVAAAGALAALLRDARLQVAGAVMLAVVTHAARHPQYGTREWSMGYLPIVRIHQQACAVIERELGGRAVRSGFPFSAILSRPELGYVDDPIDVVAYRPDAPGDERAADIIVVGAPGADDGLERYAREQNLEQIAHFTAGTAYVTIYVDRAAAAHRG